MYKLFLFLIILNFNLNNYSAEKKQDSVKTVDPISEIDTLAKNTDDHLAIYENLTKKIVNEIFEKSKELFKNLTKEQVKVVMLKQFKEIVKEKLIVLKEFDIFNVEAFAIEKINELVERI